MSNFISFMVGVASSLVASYILHLVGFFSKIVPPKFRKSFDKEFKNQKKALKSIRRDAKKSNMMRVVAMKGDTFSYPGDSGDLHDLLIHGPDEAEALH